MPPCSSGPASTEADAVVVATNGDNTNIVVGQVAQRRYSVAPRRRARARPAPGRLLRGTRPAHDLPDQDRHQHRSTTRSSSARREPPDVRDRHRRRQDRQERDPVAPRDGPRGHPRRAGARALRAARGGVRPRRPPGRRDRDPRARARRHRAAARPRARRHGRRRGQPDRLPDRPRRLRRAAGHRPRQRPAEPGALRPPRDHPDRLGHAPASSRSSSTRCPSTGSCASSTSAARGSSSSRCRSTPRRPAGASGSPRCRCPKGHASLP